MRSLTVTALKYSFYKQTVTYIHTFTHTNKTPPWHRHILLSAKKSEHSNVTACTVALFQSGISYPANQLKLSALL